MWAASSRRPAPAPVDSVALQVDDGATVALRQIEPGRWFGTGTLGPAGPVRLTAVVTRAGTRLTVPVRWTVEPAPPVPVHRWGWPAFGLALGTVGLGVWWLVLGRYRWRVSV